MYMMIKFSPYVDTIVYLSMNEPNPLNEGVKPYVPFSRGLLEPIQWFL